MQVHTLKIARGARLSMAAQIFGKLWRFYLVHFRKTYVLAQLSRRAGSCRQCGTCCALAVSCPLLTRDKLCAVYGKCRPQVCRVFPIDQRDIDEVAAHGGCCGYYFVDEEAPKPGAWAPASRPEGRPEAHPKETGP